MHSGKFISFEGSEGCGKSTQIERLTKRLENLKIDVIHTREPGGTKLAESLRNLILKIKSDINIEEVWNELALRNMKKEK